jgi:nuclease HARBI1
MTICTGVIGCIDCTHIRIVRPKNEKDSEVYRNRHGVFSINVQAICNSDLRFTNVVAKWKGSTHDSRIFDNSRVMVALRDGIAPPGHLLGDGGYSSTPFLLIPFRVPSNPAQERYFLP